MMRVIARYEPWFPGSRVLPVLGFLVFFCFPAKAAQKAVNDAPAPVVLQPVDDWAVGSGLVYWGKDCFAEEFSRSGYLKRLPLGGTIERILETTDGAHCDMPFGMSAQDDGLYYADLSEGRIERTPLAEPYLGLAVATLAAADLPFYSAQLEVTATHVYWPTSGSGKILRVSRNGGTVETVVGSLTNPLDILVVGGTVYWTEAGGLWEIGNCTTIPCTGSKRQIASFSANTTGKSIFYRTRSALNYSLYWVQRTVNAGTPVSAILSIGCSTISPCGGLGSAPSTVYTAGSDWEIGALTSDGTYLFWTESYNKAGILDGKVKRRPLSTASPEDIAVSQTYIDVRKTFLVRGHLFFARLAGAGSASGIFTLPVTAAAIQRDLAADAMEVTQAIQNLANSAPLVAGKRTYVRGYGKQLSGPRTITVEARLAGRRNGSGLPGTPLNPLNGTLALTAGGTYDRARLNDGWYFLLPESWTTGSVEFELLLDPDQNHTDSNLLNNSLKKILTFQPQPPVCVMTAPVRTHSPLPSTRDPNFAAMVDQFKRRWPVPDAWIFRNTSPVEELQVCTWYGIPHPCFGPYELEEGWGLLNGIPDRDKVIISLWTRALLSFNPDACDNISAPVHYMGMVHPAANNGGASGYASLISTNSWVQLPAHTPNPALPDWSSLFEGSVMAQELAHNYGRQHIDCGNPGDVDTSYPYPPCQIASTGPESYYGFDTTTLKPIRPDATADFMSYSQPSWVSDYTWRALVNSFARTRSPNSGSAAPHGSLAGDSVFATGVVDTASARGKITTVLTLPGSSLPPALRLSRTTATSLAEHSSTPAASYSLRLLNSSGATLLTQPLTLSHLDDHSGDSDNALFSTVFSPPAGTVATIQLLADSTILDSLTPGNHIPAVAVQQPAGGTLVDASMGIAWTASDADPADTLLFTLQYSYNSGASWQTLVTGFPGNPSGSYSLTLSDLGSLHGSSANTALLRILASDGYHTGIALSLPFTVKNRAPEAYIASPVDSHTFPAGTAIELVGGATDPEDGGLSGNSMAWAVDGNSTNSGAQAVAAGLAPGLHTVTLTATDSANNKGTASAGFQVAPLAIPLGAAPVLDGFSEEDSYASGAALRLAPYGDDGTQASVYLVRSSAHLYACFSGLKKGAALPGALAGLRLDVNHSADALAQSGDYGFLVGEDGDVVTFAGNGAGGFAAPGPGGLTAQVSFQASRWTAELRIEAAVLGGWDHLVGLALGHYARNYAGDDSPWPFAAQGNKPDSWATTALGNQPVLALLDPSTASAGGAGFTLTLLGSGFAAGMTAMWGGTALPTAVVDSGKLTATVAPAQLAPAGTVAVSVSTGAPGNFTSNSLPFIVSAGSPAITGLSPAAGMACSTSLPLVVQGSNFAADSQVLWNGTAVATQFRSASQLQAQIPGALLTSGQSAGVVVRNPTPSERLSAVSSYSVGPCNLSLFLPLIKR